MCPWYRLFLLAGGIFLSAPTALAWEIESFDADLTIQADGSLLVREAIRADFQGESRHGIYRDIPTVTQDRAGVKRSIRLTFLGAEDEAGRKWEAILTRQGVYQRIRLGDPEVTYQGRKLFKMTYRVQRILQSLPDHDELYWNVTGNQWAVPIRQASAMVQLPKPVAPNQWLATAFTGSYGSSESGVQIVRQADGTLHFAATDSLEAWEGLTLVIGWPSGLVPMPSPFQRIGWFLADNWILGIPILTFLFMFLIWWKFGKDLPRGTIAVQYEPPDGLTPAEVGTLVDDKVDMKDITATLVDLARRGWLAIEQLPANDYVFTSTSPKEEQPPLKPHESLLLKGLFQREDTKRLSDLENEFYQNLPGIRKALYEALASHHYGWGRPDRIRRFWWGMAAVGVALAFVIPSFWTGTDPALVIFSLFASSGIIALFAPFMPRKNWAGIVVTRKIWGLEEFLRRTDQDRLARESDPTALFERMLAYALALGVANQWVKAFEGIYRVQPAWYIGYDTRDFTPSNFCSRIQSMSDRMGAVLSSTPRGSGGSGFSGGFSGGGGGGGGGGAW